MLDFLICVFWPPASAKLNFGVSNLYHSVELSVPNLVILFVCTEPRKIKYSSDINDGFWGGAQTKTGFPTFAIRRTCGPVPDGT